MTENLAINISKNSVKLPEGGYRKCDNKCSYNFSYPNTNMTITNNGYNLSIIFDNYNNSPVTYNSSKYNASSGSIFCPSINSYNGNKVAAELLIEHTSVNGGKKLFVFIPIVTNGYSSSGTEFITSIIDQSAAAINTSSSSTGSSSFNYNNDSFTLQDIVPKKPFYSFSIQNNSVDCVAFDLADAIAVSSVSKLSTMIKPFTLQLTGSLLFFNEKGPNNVGIGDGIYISCKPTGSSKEKIDISKPKNTTVFNVANINSENLNTIIYIIIFALILFIVFYFFKQIFGMFGLKTASSMSSSSAT